MNFRRIEHSDLKDILLLTDDAFGKDYLTIDHLSEYINDKNNFGYYLVDDTNFVGFISLKIISIGTLQNYFLADQKWLSTHFKTQNSIAIIEQVVISPQYRNKGFSNLLLHYVLSKIEEKCNSIVCVCWLKEELNLMKKLLIKNEFNLIKTIPHYWKTDSLRKQYNCVICGEPPCLCNAEIYEFKKLIKI